MSYGPIVSNLLPLSDRCVTIGDKILLIQKRRAPITLKISTSWRSSLKRMYLVWYRNRLSLKTAFTLWEFKEYYTSYGCVRLASLGRPRGASSHGRVRPWQEPIERSHSPSHGDGMHLRLPQSDPVHKQGTGGADRVSPVKAIPTYRGRPGSTQGS